MREHCWWYDHDLFIHSSYDQPRILKPEAAGAYEDGEWLRTDADCEGEDG